MRNEIKGYNVKLYLLSAFLLFVVLESFCSVIYYQISKRGNPSIFASFHMFKIVYKKTILHIKQNRNKSVGIESDRMEPIDLIIKLRKMERNRIQATYLILNGILIFRTIILQMFRSL